ncbi:hypothetical protein HYPP_02988 [Hyphomicrobium sp. ghe19]|nr:hypothetical protein HYPP_02988 [Hyphomicrobium sp. ghe19]
MTSHYNTKVTDCFCFFRADKYTRMSEGLLWDHPIVAGSTLYVYVNPVEFEIEYSSFELQVIADQYFDLGSEIGLLSCLKLTKS